MTAGLQVPAKWPLERYRSEDRPSFVASGSNQIWGLYDFGFDGCAKEDKLKCLTVVDEFTKKSLYIDVAGSARIKRLVKVPEKSRQMNAVAK
jgi:putative transposase